ncbi:MAG: DedA family protein [bacterium]|jgi:membrane protein DedA with SNARE-associated domain|nr:DedA family protein [bacterium]
MLLGTAELLASFGYWAVLLLVGIESMGIPVPGESTLIAAGLYAGATHHLQIGLVITAAATGAILGDNLGFVIGHWGGYRLLLRYGPYVHLDERRVKVARYLFLRHGGKVVFFGRFVSILRAYAAFLAGTTRMSWPRFLFFNAAGGIVWAAGWGLAAYYLGRELERLSRPVDIAFGIAGVIAIVALLLFFRRNERRLEVEAERAFPGPLGAA